ncbi:MAG: prephenate dehydrogenase [Nitrospirales bacterium]
MDKPFHKVVIVGVGLIGGSLGLILKQKQLATTIVGVGRRIENLTLAVKLGAIDSYESKAQEAVKDADLVILATPVDTYTAHIKEWGESLSPQTIVSDVGSVKGHLVEEAEQLLPQHVRFVGAHPIAGREKSGVAYATADLFQGARCLITPTKRTDPEALESICQLWKSAGSVVSTLDPIDHDFVLGAVSHLPHVAAFALMQALTELQGQLNDSSKLLEYSGGGLRDTTRIAASSPEMWRDICLANQDNLVNMIEVYVQHLEQFKNFVEQGDAAGLEKIMAQAKQARESLQ